MRSRVMAASLKLELARTQSANKKFRVIFLGNIFRNARWVLQYAYRYSVMRGRFYKTLLFLIDKYLWMA
ncbi:MAG: hypothetical protein A2161_03875 [Candidatus Schekmanbacteria bacterium RBG_13_48_7]|uniref:Uncharacterized protein n=1 Tax=Candidatus Schekmanbacteria bacterium RBG_13_48_7 TaxID=1817878 RepID=A0A1F7S0V3_9BACT|nr:MAG: hypothetical protein A2161_03875 [Candidatus Schekmanbacteria bacterium RBG_13_48_7]